MTYAESVEKQKLAKERKAKRRAKARLLWGSPSLSALKKRVWKKISTYVLHLNRIRHQGICRICLLRPATCAYHVVPKMNGAAVHWYLDGIVAACQGCNLLELRSRGYIHGRKSGGVNYRDKHIQIFGLEFVEKIERLGEETVQYGVPFFLELEKEVESRTKTLEANQ